MVGEAVVADHPARVAGRVVGDVGGEGAPGEEAGEAPQVASARLVGQLGGVKDDRVDGKPTAGL